LIEEEIIELVTQELSSILPYFSCFQRVFYLISRRKENSSFCYLITFSPEEDKKDSCNNATRWGCARLVTLEGLKIIIA